MGNVLGKNIYDYCYDYHIYFNIKIYIAVLCHYDMYQIILYTIYINYVTFMTHNDNFYDLCFYFCYTVD